MKNNTSHKEKCQAILLLSAIGDSIGYGGGSIEFNYDGEEILDMIKKMKGIENLDLSNHGYWPVSDDTVMHIATAKAIANVKEDDIDKIMKRMAKEYIDCWEDMGGRAPGGTCGSGVHKLSNGIPWNKIPYSKSGGGCGGSMRSAIIGGRFFGKENRKMLTAIGIESGRLTHNHPTGFFGALVSSTFTAFGLEKIPIIQWGYKFVNEIFPMSMDYLKSCERDYEEIEKDVKYFLEHFKTFLKDRHIDKEDAKKPYYKEEFLKIENVKKREKYWKKFSYRGWPGGSGDDSVIIAYDALIMGNLDYKKTIIYSSLHGGDSDSTGTISMAWYGAIKGLNGVIDKHLQIEKSQELKQLGTIISEFQK